MQKKKISGEQKKNKIQVSTQEMQEFGQKMVGLCTVQEKLSKMQSPKTNMGKVHSYQRVNYSISSQHENKLKKSMQ